MTTGTSDLPYEMVGGEARLRVRVSPRAAHNRIGGLHRDAEGRVSLLVRVTTAPEKGKANKAVIDAVAHALGLAPSRLKVKAGRADRTKLIVIAGDPADIEPALRGLATHHQEV